MLRLEFFCKWFDDKSSSHERMKIKNNMHTFLAPGGVGSKIFACISEGKLA